jgi:hypothetical protein
MRVAVVSAVLVLVLVTATSASYGTSSHDGIEPRIREKLLKVATNVANYVACDSHPYGIEAVRTTKRKVASLKRKRRHVRGGKTPVYFVAMRGSFVCNVNLTPAKPGEPSRHTPTRPRTVLTLELSLSLGSSSDVLHLSDHYPDLSALGTPVSLSPDH